MRRSIIPIAIFLLVLAGAIAGWKIFWPMESQRYAATKAVLRSRSEIRLVYTVAYEHGPIAREQLTFTNVDGASKVAYEGSNRAGTTIARFTQAVDGYEVAKLFGKTVQDGVWELTNKPPRGDTSKTYTILVYQLSDHQNGSREITFTDPHYWATTGGRQYDLHLDKDKPVPDLVKLHSKSLTEPRYADLVADFEGFSSPGFRTTLATAREKLRAA